MLRIVLTEIVTGKDSFTELYNTARNNFTSLQERTFRRILNKYTIDKWIKRVNRKSVNEATIPSRTALGFHYAIAEEGEKIMRREQQLRCDWRLHNVRFRYRLRNGTITSTDFESLGWRRSKTGNYLSQFDTDKVFAYPTKNAIEVMPQLPLFGKDSYGLGADAGRHCDQIAARVVGLLNSKFGKALEPVPEGTPSGEFAQPNPALDLWTRGLNVRWLRGWIDHSGGVAELEYRIGDLDKTIDVEAMPRRIRNINRRIEWMTAWNPYFRN